ncbi:MAG TPA: ribonuclease D [Gammaproteobacteria bacterium]
MAYEFIDTPAALQRLCAQLRGSPWLALDTEFLRERTYRAQLCLVQVAAPGDVLALVDTLALESLEPLFERLFDPATVKVLHAARQDLEIFHDLTGRVPEPLFDTQLAATLAGCGDQVGYADLVQRLLGVTLDKSQSRTDWTARPLSPEQLDYAADDVRHLGPLYAQLGERLQRAGRLEWLDQDFTALADPAQYRNDPEQAWQRLRGAGQLRGGQLNALRALAAWREREAQAADKPRRWIVDDAALLALARARPARREQLGRIRGLSEGLVRRHGADLLELIHASRQAAPDTPPPSRPAPLAAAEEALVDALMALLRLLAERHEVSVATLATRRDLEALVRGARDVPLLHGWRHGLAGGEVERFLGGATRLRSADGRLRLEPAD